MLWAQEWNSGLAHVWTEATSLVSSARHGSQMKGLVHTQAPREKHIDITIPQPRRSFLPLLVKYARYIKIRVQTEGLTVAQSRPGSVGTAQWAARAPGESGMRQGWGRKYSGKPYCGKQRTHLRAGWGGSGTAFVPRHLHP